MRKLTSIVCAGLLVMFITVPQVNAVSLLIDVNPPAPGIQSITTVMVGDPVVADVVVTDLTDFLQGFEFDVDFNAPVVAATNVSSGGFLTAPFVVIENDIAPPDVNYSEVALGVSSSTGNGILASITFQALALGMSDLVLNDVILSGVTGPGDIFEITPVTLGNGKINVAPIPEPASLLLIATGLVGLIGLRQYRKRS